MTLRHAQASAGRACHCVQARSRLPRRHPARSGKLVGFEDMADFVKSLERPRKVIILVQAGKPVDETIDKLLEHMEEGDVIIGEDSLSSRAGWRTGLRAWHPSCLPGNP